MLIIYFFIFVNLFSNCLFEKVGAYAYARCLSFFEAECPPILQGWIIHWPTIYREIVYLNSFRHISGLTHPPAAHQRVGKSILKTVPLWVQHFSDFSDWENYSSILRSCEMRCRYRTWRSTIQRDDINPAEEVENGPIRKRTDRSRHLPCRLAVRGSKEFRAASRKVRGWTRVATVFELEQQLRKDSRTQPLKCWGLHSNTQYNLGGKIDGRRTLWIIVKDNPLWWSC